MLFLFPMTITTSPIGPCGNLSHPLPRAVEPSSERVSPTRYRRRAWSSDARGT